MTLPKIPTLPRKQLSLYELACGYIQERGLDGMENAEVKLWHETPMLHVRAHDYSKGERLFWESFETATEARTFFNKAEKFIKAKEEMSFSTVAEDMHAAAAEAGH